MGTYNVSVLAEEVLHKLKSEEVKRISSIKNFGFRVIIQHFESIGNLFVDNYTLREYLEKQHEVYSGDKKIAWRWSQLRRGAELLMYFAATGKVDMPPLPDWEKRYCQLCIEPTEEQLSNNDNIYGSLW